MPHRLLFIVMVAAVLGAHASAFVDQPAAAPDVDALGPQVGSKIPDFTLPDQHGRQQSLSTLRGPKGLVLVFSRSADWWPYCKTQLVELQSRVNELRKNGMGLAVITYDPVPVLQEFAARRGITFPLLSDAGSATIKRYGILNTTVDPGNALFGYPFPGTFVLTPDGTVTARFFERAYEERSTINSVMVRLGGTVDVPATRVSAPHMQITSYSTDQVAAPGTRFSLVLDIEPAEGVHVYAPEVQGYRPVRLKVTPQPWLLLRDAHYPASEIYHFKPLDERVPVYQRAFRIVQDVTLDASREAQAALKGKTDITISGTLDYQACDDKVCFNPQSVPLSWTIAVKPLDRERVKQP